MGNAESGNPVRNMDKRTARREYKSDFSAAITRYRQRMGHHLPNQSVTGGGSDIIWDNSGNVKVFVRKRPIFQHEIDSSEFDVITCFPDKVVVHDARMHNDMKRQLINHHEFTFDKVFHEKTSNEVVYEQAARPLVNIAVNGGYSTALVYGQTGSGKTFTMSSIYKQAAQDIFSMLHDQMGRFAEPAVVSLSFIEIAGDSVSDLLNGFHPTQLTSASDGSVHAYPVVEPVVSDADELLAVIQHGLNIRTTAATGVHDSSSRSHAMLRIFINRTDISDSGETIEGTLTLVDLAGSEHRIDSMYHGKERRKETSYINASLMALKDCIRSRAAQFAAAAADGQKVPNLTANAHIYRKSKLTMALKNSFVLPHARTIVIATVSPASKDTEHSLNTLRHACLMNGQDTNPEETRFITGGTTTTEQIGEINISNIARRNQLLKRQQGSIEEAKTSNGNTLDNRVAKAANQEVELTEKMKLKMRRMSENRSFAALDPRIKDIFKVFRQKLGREQRQMRRMRVNRFEEMETVLQKLAQDEAEARRKLGIRDGDEEDDNDDDGGEDGTIDDHVDGFHSSRKDEEIAEELHMPPPSARDVPSRKPRGPPQHQPSSSPLSQMHEYVDDFEEPVVSSGRRPSSAKAITTTATTTVPTASPRVPFQQIYDAIYIARDEVPERILQRQLRAMLKLHHYADVEVQAFLSGMSASSSATATSTGAKATGSVSSSNRIASSTASSSRPATPTNRRVSSGSGGAAAAATGSNGATTATTMQHTATGTTTTTPHRSRPVGSLGLSVAGHANATRESVSESGMKPSLSAPSLPGGNGGSGSGSGSGSGGALGVKDVSSIIKGTIKRTATPTRRTSVGGAAASSALDLEDHSSSLSLAKQKVEEEARMKKQRQEQARLHREEQERLKAEKVLQKKGAGGRSSKLLMKTAEEAANDAERERHAEEVAKLTAALEDDQAARPEDKLSAAMKFGIKKQLSIHKAAILRLERAKLALQNGTSTGGVVGVGTAGAAAAGGGGAAAGAARPSNPFDDMPLPTTKKTASAGFDYDDGSAAAASAYEPPPAGALAHLKKKSSSTTSSSAAAKQRLAGARGVTKTRGAFEYDPADFGHVPDDDNASAEAAASSAAATAAAAAALQRSPPPAVNEDTFYDHRPVGSRSIAAAQAMERAPHGYDPRSAAGNHHHHQQHHHNDYADDGAADEFMISETGRPIGKHLAQHILQQHRPPSNSSSAAAAARSGNSQGTAYGSSIGGRSTGGSNGSGSGGGSGGVIGYHIEERSSYDSDTFSRAMHQPVGLRSDHYFAANSNSQGNSYGNSSQQPYPTSSTRGGYPTSSQASQQQPYDDYFQEAREDFSRRPTSSSFQSQQQPPSQPLSARGNSNLRGGGRR